MSLGFQPRRRIPATIVTGFLGAGKTSLIRHLLRHPGGRKLGLLINEFGDVGVDRADLLGGCGDATCGEDDVIELSNGCLCCTVADDFLPAMLKLVDRPDPPDHLIIETSGLALPKPLLQAFAWPDLKARATVDGVVAVVDAAAVAAGLFAPDPAATAAQRAADPALDHESPLEELFEEQLACADLVVLNKLDLVDSGAEAQARAAAQAEMRPGVGLVPAAHGALDAAVLLGLSAAAEDDLANRKSHHDGHDEDDHGHDEFASYALDVAEQPDQAAAEARLRALMLRVGALRAKGFVRVAGKPMRLVVQGVGGRVDSWFDRPWRGDERPRVVVIGLADQLAGPEVAAAALTA